jgi:hypothetical protein
MRKVTPTIYSVYLLTHMLKGKRYTPQLSTTLNEKLNISVPTPPETAYPTLKYTVLGKGGHANSTGTDGFAIPHIHSHEPTTASLFYLMPWVARELTNDLPPEKRERYALRKVEIKDGRNYAMYYARRDDYETTPVDMNRITTVNGSDVSVPFVPDSANLNPTPPVIPPAGSIPALSSGDVVEVSSITPIVLTPFDIAELVNVARVLHNDERYAVISEIGICTGIDVMTTVPGAGNAPMSFKEAAYVQIMQHITQHQVISPSDDNYQLNVDIGNGEALTTSV